MTAAVIQLIGPADFIPVPMPEPYRREFPCGCIFETVARRAEDGLSVDESEVQTATCGSHRFPGEANRG
jgi:hypothetical protein